MKNLLIITFSILFSNVLCSQFVDGLALSDLKENYISIELCTRGISNFSLNVDFGQETKLIKAKNQELLDENGESIRFNSAIGALNFMYDYGYEVPEAYNHDGECIYLLKRRKGYDVQ